MAKEKSSVASPSWKSQEESTSRRSLAWSRTFFRPDANDPVRESSLDLIAHSLEQLQSLILRAGSLFREDGHVSFAASHTVIT